MLLVFCGIFAVNFISGHHSTVIQGRSRPIVGGYEVNIEQTPYQVSLKRYGYHICGGSILSDHIVISAAHCVYNSKGLSIFAGATLLTSSHGQTFKVARFIIHPEYKNINMDYDVALLILNGQLQFNHFVKPIPLAKLMAAEGSKVFISGWGYLKRISYDTPNHLMGAEVEVFPASKCTAAYWFMSTVGMICAGVNGGQVDACMGDSGGPMVYKGKLVGVVSTGNGCGYDNYFTLYAKISMLHEWIVNTVKKNTIHLL